MIEIIPSGYTYIEELQQNDWNQLIVVCERLSLKCGIDITKEEMSEEIYHAISDNPMLVVKMIPRETVEFLFELWDMKEPPLLLDPYRVQLYQLTFLGFARLIDTKTISVNMEVKDMLFFYLKSHRISWIMEQYSQWEQVIFGMLFYYGIIDLTYFYEVFCMIMDQEPEYEEFIEFIKVRIVFWGNTALLQNEGTKKLYLSSKEVVDRNQVFQDWNENSDIGFHIFDREEYLAMARGNGISVWDGIQELFQFALDEVKGDKYECMILVKSIIVMIQNNSSYLDVVMKSSSIVDKNQEKEEELCRILKRLFYSTPLYGAKGYSRQELAEERQEPFHIIDGGKS